MTDKVAVTQADRELYVTYARLKQGPNFSEAWAAKALAGDLDRDHVPQVAAMARIATAEACARIAEGEAERIRVRAITGNMDPVEAGMIDETISVIATAIRLQQGSEKP